MCQSPPAVQPLVPASTESLNAAKLLSTGASTETATSSMYQPRKLLLIASIVSKKKRILIRRPAYSERSQVCWVHDLFGPLIWRIWFQFVPSVETYTSLRSHAVPVSSVSYQLRNASVALAPFVTSIHGETSEPLFRVPVT